MYRYCCCCCLLWYGSMRRLATSNCSTHGPLLLQVAQRRAVSSSTLTQALHSPMIVINGQRCLLAPCAEATATTDQPPLVLIPGMAQSVSMYEAHAASICRSRSCLVIEPIGLGNAVSSDSLTNVSLAAQAARVRNCAVQTFPQHDTFCIAGFSLGGRIAMAIACQYPDKVRCLHVTGVGSVRSDSGKVMMAAWTDLLRKDSMQGFAWSALTTTYSPSFLLRNRDRLVDWIATLHASQTVNGLLAILHQAHPTEATDPWSVLSMASKIRANNIPGRLCIGSDDRVVDVVACRRLAEVLNWPEPTIVDGTGHAVPGEEPRLWRQHLIDTLNKASD